MQELYVVTGSDKGLVQGVFSTFEKARAFINDMITETGAPERYYNVCKTHLNNGDTTYIRWN